MSMKSYNSVSLLSFEIDLQKPTCSGALLIHYLASVCSTRLRPSQFILACFPAVSGELLRIAGGLGGQFAFACSSSQENVHLTLLPVP